MTTSPDPAETAADTLPRWDLTALFAGPDDPRLESDLSGVRRDAEAFAGRYRGRLSGLAPSALAEALARYEALHQRAVKPSLYADLRFAADASPENGALLQKTRERTTEATLPLLFFDIELATLSAQQLEALADDPSLARYAHYLRCVRDRAAFQLSEPEEKILEEMANTGRRALVRLFEELTANLRVDYDGRELTLSEALDLQQHPARAVREASASALTGALSSQARTVAFLYNTLIQDKATEDRMRGYVSPEHPRHLGNELSAAVVETAVRIAEEGFPLAARYYEAKRRLLGLPELAHFDRYAPIDSAAPAIPFEEARAIILAAFDRFHPDLGAAGREFFAHPWIDAQPRKGKRGGAFCAYVTPDTHPYLFLSYLGKPTDVKTLAHELGHGIHAYLSRGQNYLSFHGTLPLAEVASTFAEALVFAAQERSLDPRTRRALYAGRIEQSCATIFRQATLYRFEQATHAARRDGELSVERLGKLWQEKTAAMFGRSVQLGEEHALWWSYIPHFFATPFYVYAYTVGEMLALALFHTYRQEGPAFAPKYLAFLADGGSRSPQELLARLGVDLSDPDFWRGALAVLEEDLATFESLAAAAGAFR